MGIQDRDYMKRRPSGDGDRRSPSCYDADDLPAPDSKVEEFFRRFLQKYPRFFLYVGIALGALIVIAVIAAKLTGGR